MHLSPLRVLAPSLHSNLILHTYLTQLWLVSKPALVYAQKCLLDINSFYILQYSPPATPVTLSSSLRDTMAMRPGPPRQPVGSAAWCAEERSTALQVSRTEIDEFSYSARNELEWLNEHMAEVFSENQMYVSNASNIIVSLTGA